MHNVGPMLLTNTTQTGEFTSRAAYFWLCCLLAAGLTACPSNDIGKPCPQLKLDAPALQTDGHRATTQEVVAQDPDYPCDQLVCIATLGHDSYCSKPCDHNNDCPTGFDCRVIQDVGPFAGRKFCAFARCSTADDCGSSDDFCCASDQGADPNQELGLCSFSDSTWCTSPLH